MNLIVLKFSGGVPIRACNDNFISDHWWKYHLKNIKNFPIQILTHAKFSIQLNCLFFCRSTDLRTAHHILDDKITQFNFLYFPYNLQWPQHNNFKYIWHLKTTLGMLRLTRFYKMFWRLDNNKLKPRGNRLKKQSLNHEMKN